MMHRKLTDRWSLDQLLAFGFGVGFILLLVILAVAIPNPTDSTFYVFRVVLALAAAGFATAIVGLLSIKLSGGRRWQIRAGGAIVLFLVVFFGKPATLVTSPSWGNITWEVSPTQITQGQAVTIRWQVEKARRIKIEPIGDVAKDGEGEYRPDRDTSYTLLAYSENSTDPSQLKQTMVTVATPEPGVPVIQEFNALPMEVVQGQAEPVMVSWRVTNATEIEIPEANIRSVALEGSRSIPAPDDDTRYDLQVINNQTGLRSTALATVRVITATPTPTAAPTQTSTPAPTPTATPTPRRSEYRLGQQGLRAEEGCTTQDYRVTLPDATLVIDTERGDEGHTVMTYSFSRNYLTYGSSVDSPGSYHYSVKTGTDALGRPQKVLTVTLCATERTLPLFSIGKLWVPEQLVFDFVIYARTP
jgi:hypothetical protein